MFGFGARIQAVKMATVVLSLLTFHGPTGARIDLNAAAITSIRDPAAMPGHWNKGVNCIILVDNSPPIAVLETCDQVRQSFNGVNK